MKGQTKSFCKGAEEKQQDGGSLKPWRNKVCYQASLAVTHKALKYK
jgi:hypothetical protein